MQEKKKITYFDEITQDNTTQLLKTVKRYVEETGIHDIVISSNSGKSALELSKLLGDVDVNLVAISLHSGFSEGDDISWNKQYKQQLEENGVTCFIGTHALSGIDRGFSRKFGGFNPAELVAETYKTISVGVKVAVEISIMAADAGLVPTTRPILAIGGHRGYGVDSAIVLKSAHMNNIFDLKVHEILAMTKK